jgi:deoxyxylulose-5-phosphate synthase
VEEGIKNGGAGMLLSESLAKNGFDVFSKYRVAAIDDNFALPSETCDIYDYLGLSAEALAKKILSVPLEKDAGK